jgi:hypothetical protein
VKEDRMRTVFQLELSRCLDDEVNDVEAFLALEKAGCTFNCLSHEESIEVIPPDGERYVVDLPDRPKNWKSNAGGDHTA